MKLPVQAKRILTVIINPQPHRRLDDDCNFVIVAMNAKEHRTVELHLRDDELRKLAIHADEYLRDKPERTMIASYE